MKKLVDGKVQVLFMLIYVCIATDCDFECPKKIGSFADPCTCRRFYKCADGTAYRNFCPTGLNWDDEKKLCTYPSEAKCGPLEAKEESKEEVVEEVPKCDPGACQPPFCFCSPTGQSAPLPTSDPTKDIPQMITLTFDGAVNTNNYDLYAKLLSLSRKNSTDCQLRGTFFVKHDYNNYYHIQLLYHKGQEIAVSSVTGDDLSNANHTTWKTEITTMKELLHKFSSIPKEDILGLRAPSLKPGNNVQYDVMINEGFLWDSSVSTLVTDQPIWPYTLDYRIPHECKIKSCPTKSFPGVWEIPVNIHYVNELGGGRCSYLDQCVFAHYKSDDILEWLIEDFKRHYETNRAPYILSFHTNWFTHPHQVEGLHKFVEWSFSLPDVYYITATELLIWMTEPSVDLLKDLTSSCKDLQREKPCDKPSTCELEHIEPDGTATLRYMSTCSPCPDKYPWI